MQMIIANRLIDGRIVFLAPDTGWTNDIALGAVADSDAEAAGMLARAQQHEQANLVVDPNLISIRIHDGIRQPTEYREYIRAHGPSVPIPGQLTGQH